ncbi:MAG: hypothetical protein M1831_006727 [Alyxoria varia]|nr:MAG: hypothetical protein M1831_006727 [Alyxoria varia]
MLKIPGKHNAASESREKAATMFYHLFPLISVRTVVVLAICAFCIYKCVSKIAKYWAESEYGARNGCRPPAHELKYRWPLGLDVVLEGLQAKNNKRLLALFGKYFEDTGTTTQLTILGGTGWITFDPQNVEAMLSSQFNDFHLGPRRLPMMAMVGEGIFTQDGSPWKHSRELLRHQFVRMQYQNLEGFREHVEHLIDTMKDVQGTVDLQPLFYRLTLDTTISMILGQSTRSFKEDIDAFSKHFDEASLTTATRTRFGDVYYIYAPKGFFAACKMIKKYTERFIKSALQHGDKTTTTETDKASFIHQLDAEYNHDMTHVRDQVINVLLAGRDTTATTLSYVFWLLVRHPEALDKLRSEIDSVLGEDKNVTRAYLQRMPYLQNVLKETLRLYPPVPLNTRFCKHTTSLPRGGGPDGTSPILVRENMPVAYSVYHMQRRKDLYGEDANSFRPERWEEGELTDIKWAYLPFNGGPRICLGKDFANMLASYAIARIIQAFPDIKLPQGETREEPGNERQNVSIVLSNAEGCRVQLTS